MRLFLRDPKGIEISTVRVQHGREAPWEAMLLLGRCVTLEVGSILVADDDNIPNLNEPMVLPTITAPNLLALAGRLEARAKMLAETEPGNATDLQIAARLARHACKIWVSTSVSLTR